MTTDRFTNLLELLLFGRVPTKSMYFSAVQEVELERRQPKNKVPCPGLRKACWRKQAEWCKTWGRPIPTIFMQGTGLIKPETKVPRAGILSLFLSPFSGGRGK